MSIRRRHTNLTTLTLLSMAVGLSLLANVPAHADTGATRLIATAQRVDGAIRHVARKIFPEVKETRDQKRHSELTLMAMEPEHINPSFQRGYTNPALPQLISLPPPIIG